MSVFGPYSRYYDLLNRDKDYDGEVEYVAGLLRRHSKRPVRSVLDVGCGTGSHDLLQGRPWQQPVCGDQRHGEDQRLLSRRS